MLRDFPSLEPKVWIHLKSSSLYVGSAVALSPPCWGGGEPKRARADRLRGEAAR